MSEGIVFTPSAVRAPIQRLPEALINQIAAGEVVERPASIIKELVENSLDAGATRIDILLLEGGTEEITIIDNGCGIEEAELPLALERHATSKIRSLSDLERLHTFGFRGEALASIASVSEIEVTSRTATMARAAVVKADFGLCQRDLAFVAAPTGTSIRVKKLFQKIPARQKFLRSAGTEFSHCSRLVREMALGNPSIAFYLHHQGRLVQSFAPGDRLSRMKECLKPGWEPFRWEEKADGLSVEAFLTPFDWISDRGEVFLYLNGRPIRNKTILSALRNGYLTVLGPHHEPSGVLYIEMKSDWVDVNVHPQKWEVRILRQDAIYAWLLGAMKRRLPEPAIIPAETLNPSLFEMPNLSVEPRDSQYLLVENSECVLIVDKLKLALTARVDEWKTRGLGTKPLARPFMYRKPVAPKTESRYLDALSQSGVMAQFFDGGDWAIQSIPTVLEENTIEFFLDRCFAHIEAGHSSLCLAELADLTTKNFDNGWLNGQIEKYRSLLQNGLTCPHGKPVSYSISKLTLNKYFEKRCD